MPSPLRKKGHPKLGGRKKGTKNKKTILKEEAFKEYQQKMLQDLFDIITAQKQLAKGLPVILRPSLVKNQKTGKLERNGELKQVRDPDEIEELMNSGGEGKDYHIIYAKDPSEGAIKDIVTMLFGKPPESLNIQHEGSVLILRRKNVK